GICGAAAAAGDPDTGTLCATRQVIQACAVGGQVRFGAQPDRRRMSKLFEALHKGKPESLELVDILGPDTYEPPAALPPAEAIDHHRQMPSQPAKPHVDDRPSIAPASAPGIRTVSLKLLAKSPILPFEDLQGRASEQYRIARTRILQHQAAPRIIMVTSPGARDGKTVSAINLAGALSLRAGFNVLLLDGDFRRPAVHDALGLASGPGLSDVLAGSNTLEDALVHVEQ